MVVLSLFDGISCGRVALERAGIPVTAYYACEIDKHAIKVSSSNWPDIIQLGSVTELYDWVISVLPKIDLLIGGSPCQGFSFIGKQLNFKDPRSALFFEYVRIWKTVKLRNPKAKFLLENVLMKASSKDVITQLLGVNPIVINSALVSAQHRKRLYWTDLGEITQPEDKGIFIEDILHDSNDLPVIKNFGQLIYKPYKSQCLDANYYKGVDIHGQSTGCIRVGTAELNGPEIIKRIYDIKGKAPALVASTGGNQSKKIAIDAKHWRKLSPIECERLQGLPDNYTAGISDTQRYKCLGNGWQVDTIVHIFKNLI